MTENILLKPFLHHTHPVSFMFKLWVLPFMIGHNSQHYQSKNNN